MPEQANNGQAAAKTQAMAQAQCYTMCALQRTRENSYPACDIITNDPIPISL